MILVWVFSRIASLKGELMGIFNKLFLAHTDGHAEANIEYFYRQLKCFREHEANKTMSLGDDALTSAFLTMKARRMPQQGFLNAISGLLHVLENGPCDTNVSGGKVCNVSLSYFAARLAISIYIAEYHSASMGMISNYGRIAEKTAMDLAPSFGFVPDQKISVNLMDNANGAA